MKIIELAEGRHSLPFIVESSLSSILCFVLDTIWKLMEKIALIVPIPGSAKI
ncbi:MAG: hypothetical protein LUQ54_07245 [Methanoregula sp.]|nr:hypothetical protein [Methanoregula sp.]